MKQRIFDDFLENKQNSVYPQQSFGEIYYLCSRNAMKMKRENVLKRLQALKNSLSEVGVTRLGLFGSTARGENTSRSDIDILLDFGAGCETYVNFLAACHILEDNFKRNKVDIVTCKGLSPYIGETIMKEVVYV